MLLAAAWLAGLGAASLWTLQPQVAWWRLGLMWSAVAAGGALALSSWHRAPAGALAWDGAAWTWSEAGRPARTGTIEPCLDLQHTILVRWHDEGMRRWLWLERRRCRDRWGDVRRAVYSRARPAALPAEPPAAKP